MRPTLRRTVRYLIVLFVFRPAKPFAGHENDLHFCKPYGDAT